MQQELPVWLFASLVSSWYVLFEWLDPWGRIEYWLYFPINQNKNARKRSSEKISLTELKFDLCFCFDSRVFISEEKFAGSVGNADFPLPSYVVAKFVCFVAPKELYYRKTSNDDDNQLDSMTKYQLAQSNYNNLNRVLVYKANFNSSALINRLRSCW